MRNLRVVISCVTFEVAKVVKPIEYYRADKAILIHWGGKPPYTQFLSEVRSRLRSSKIPLEERSVMIMEFAPVMKEVRSIIKEENARGNHVYVNIGAGPQVFSSAAMVACMMEGAVPFNAPTKEFTVGHEEFFDDERPVGTARDVYDPKEVPVFRMSPPDQDLIGALGLWKEVVQRYGDRSTKEVMEALEAKGLIKDIFEDDRRKKVSQGSLMRYRRNFLEKWEAEGWIVKDGRGRYSITDQGDMMLSIFG